VGFEKSPIDPLNDDDAMWLRACIWPGQRDRLRRFEAALEAYRGLAQSATPVKVERASVGDVPARLAEFEGSAIAYQTIVRDYLDPLERERYVAGMNTWLRQHPGMAHWVELELAGDQQPPDRSCAITVHVADSAGEVHSLALGRCHPHPRVIAIHTGQVESFRQLVAPR
jgi:hypothetical protein